MPEGDTIHKLAAAIAPRLEGRALADGRVRDLPGLSLTGRRVERVEARGKHLFTTLDDGRELRSHLGMHGSWHRYRPGEPWQRPARQASIVLATESDVLVCFNAKEVELLRAGGLRARDARRALGPDLVTEPVSGAAVLERAARVLPADAPAADVLLDQRVASGIGNVYKSEVLFLEGVHPLTPLARLDAATAERLWATAHRLLRANLHGGPRATRAAADGAGELWVYRRAGRPCLRCRAPIATARLGRDRRSTYWCPDCQPEEP